MMIPRLGFNNCPKEPQGKLKEVFQRLQVLDIQDYSPLGDVGSVFRSI
jgi:hypothetical protein